MATSAQRYSEKRLRDDLTLYVLLSETLEFRTGEIVQALREDYPQLSWSDLFSDTGNSGDGADFPIKTGEFAMGVVLGERDENAPPYVHFGSMPGRCDVQWEPILDLSRHTFPTAKSAVGRHQGYLMISLGSVDSTLEARFDAMRRLTCIGAMFARLPICLGIYNPGADLLVAPQDWIDAADTALAAKVPLAQWISLGVTAVPDGQDPPPVTVQSIGFAAFAGREVCMPMVRMPPGDAAKWVHLVIRLIMEYGHKLHDSDTVGPDDGAEKVRVRHWPEGYQGAQTDMWALVHAKTTLNEQDAFGPRSRPPRAKRR